MCIRDRYYTYLMNGLMTQLVRIEPGNSVEEAHMRNRQLIARWVFEKGYISLLSGKTSSKCKVKNGDTILMDRKGLIDFLG